MHVLTWLKNMNPNIIFLQETHVQDNTIKSWVNNWKGEIFSHDNGNA